MRHQFVQGGLARVDNSNFGQRKAAETYGGLSRVTDANMLSKGNVVAEVSNPGGGVLRLLPISATMFDIGTFAKTYTSIPARWLPLRKRHRARWRRGRGAPLNDPPIFAQPVTCFSCRRYAQQSPKNGRRSKSTTGFNCVDSSPHIDRTDDV